MFSSHERLKRKTPSQGIDRREFIAHLVEEYYTTTDLEAQEQVSANLANFAYDPINWNFLKEAETLQLFEELIALQNPRLQLHGIAGLCNICLDTQAFVFITSPANCEINTNAFLRSENNEVILNCITLYYQLLNTEDSAQLKQLIATPEVLKKLISLRQSSSDHRITNIATLFLEDFGTRTELVELPKC